MSNLYYKNINNKSPTNNHHMPRLFNFLNNKLHKSQENKRTKIMSELLLSNPDLLENFQRRYSKTPCRLRMKSSFSSKNSQNNLNSAKYTNLRIKMDRSLPNKRNYNWKQNKLKNNLKKNNTTPLMKHIKQREKERKRKEKNKKNQINKNKKDNNVLSRSESYCL